MYALKSLMTKFKLPIMPLAEEETKHFGFVTASFCKGRRDIGDAFEMMDLRYRPQPRCHYVVLVTALLEKYVDFMP